MSAAMRCPHCRGADTLEKTSESHTDTNGVKCIVWRCRSCKYEEGHAVAAPVEARK